jgi:hypothetical protein
LCVMKNGKIVWTKHTQRHLFFGFTWIVVH